MVETVPEPDNAEISALRQSFSNMLENINHLVDPRDVKRIKNDDKYVKRFLMHNDNDQKLALDMVVQTMKWRKENGVNDISEKSLDESLIKKKILGSHNRDVDGCKMLIFTVKNYVKGEVSENIKTLLIYFVERLEREENGKWITVFFDMKDTGFKNMDMEFIQYFINLFKSYYPWILNYIIVFEMPWLLNALWKIIKGWLPPKSIDKIKFLDKKSLVSYVSPDQSLLDWGGDDDYDFEFVSENEPTAPHLNGDIMNRKVHFALASLIPPAKNGDAKDNDIDFLSDLKFEVSPDELVFRNALMGAECTISLKNNSPVERFAFKMKTTSPDKYRSRPSFGVVGPSDSVDVTITLAQDLSPSILAADKFLVAALPCSSPFVSQAEFSNMYKKANKLDITEVRLSLSVKSEDSTTKQTSSSVSPKSSSLAAKVDMLISQQSDLEKALRMNRRLLWIIFALIGLMLIVLRRTEPASLVVESGGCSPACPGVASMAGN